MANKDLKKVSKEEIGWLKESFEPLLNKHLHPDHFWNSEDLIEILSGADWFRGTEYNGNGLSFEDDCQLSIMASNDNEKLFKKLHRNFHYGLKQCVVLEYYILAVNFKIIMDIFDRSFKVIKEVKTQVNQL